MRYHRFLPLILTAGVLTGCGGSSGSGNNLSGVAAIGAPIVSGTVTAVCSDGEGFSGTVTTSNTGAWSVKIDAARLPCALQVSYGEPAQLLHGYAADTGTANITPLTDLIIAYASGQIPSNWFSTGTPPANPVSDVDDLLTALANAGYTVPAGLNPFSTKFSATAGNAYDDLLEALAQGIANDPALVDYAALVTLVKDGDLGAAIPAAPDDGGDIEGPADLQLLIDYADTYTVACAAVAPENRGLATRDHARGNIIIGADGSIDFDTGAQFNFSPDDIGALFDRTMLEGDIRRIVVNYDEDDSGRQITIYLDASLNVTEIRYQDGQGGITRAAIGGTDNCGGDTGGNEGLGDSNGASAQMNGADATHTGYVQSLSNNNTNDEGFNFIAKDANNSSSPGWNIQGRLQSGDQSCDNDVVVLFRYQDGGIILANSCTINITTIPDYQSATPYIIEGTFSGEFSISGEAVSVTNGTFRYLVP